MDCGIEPVVADCSRVVHVDPALHQHFELPGLEGEDSAAALSSAKPPVPTIRPLVVYIVSSLEDLSIVC